MEYILLLPFIFESFSLLIILCAVDTSHSKGNHSKKNNCISSTVLFIPYILRVITAESA